jgi:hypothetical protein
VAGKTAQHGEKPRVCERIGDPSLEDPAGIPGDGQARLEVIVEALEGREESVDLLVPGSGWDSTIWAIPWPW